MPVALPILLLLISHSQQTTVAVRSEFKAALDAPVKSASVSGFILFPPGQKRVESVIVTVARAMSPPREYSDARWHGMAERVNAAFLFLSLQQPLGENIPVADQVVRNAAAGGADGLVALLNRFAADSGHDELRTVPLFFFGGSAGGSFGTTFAMLHPSRTIGLVRYNSHSRGLPIDVERIRTIPALLLAGGDDQVAGTEDAEKLWRQGRALEAPWTFGVQPGQGHLAGLELATAFILSWIEGVMHHRLAGGKLREIDPANTWRADNRTSRIDPGRALTADLPHTSWLPDEKTAKLWQEVVAGK
jgi:pimeloyl-ACP methyl ester carboxylesterase